MDGRCKVTDEQIDTFIRMKNQGYLYSDICKKTGLNEEQAKNLGEKYKALKEMHEWLLQTYMNTKRN